MDEPAAPLSVLRPALELAWLVARTGSQARPPQPAPGRLRPLLRAAKLPDRMLATVRKVVEDDEEFRHRVAQVADETLLGRGAWLWLVRPEGWEAELAELSAVALAARSEVTERREARDAQRQLDEVRAALARAEAELALLRPRNADLAEQADTDRQARRRSEAEVGARDTELRSVRAELARARTSVADLEAQVEHLAARVEAASRREEEAAGERDAALRTMGLLQVELARAGSEAARNDARTDQTRAAVGDALARAASAAHDLGAALQAATHSLGVDQRRDGGESPATIGFAGTEICQPAPAREGVVIATDTGTGRDGDTDTGPGSAAPALRRVLGRTPLRLPPALFDDSAEAAAYLVRVSGVVLIVDGYNVTLSSWPDLDLSTQRQRLVDALAELVMRAGVSVRVVFDGAERGNRLQPPAAVRQRMIVEFSPSEVEADEIILKAVERLDPGRPVVVATDDRRVRQGVLRHGANVISVDQLLAVLGRFRTAG